jgi:RNA polymerase sigma factor (TIGR02999 family)
LEPGALVNETFLKLLERPTGFAGRRHFLAFASKVMLDTLIDYERRRFADKRGGTRLRVTLSLVEDGDLFGDGRQESLDDILAFREVLARLETLDRRKADVVRLRVLWGLDVVEVARLLDVSEPTVVRDWRFARAWLAERLSLPYRPTPEP